MSVSVLLAGPDEETLAVRAIPAFAAAGLEVVAVATTPEQLSDLAAVAGAGVLVVEAGVAATPEEAAAMLEKLAGPDTDTDTDTDTGTGTGLIVIWPLLWGDRTAALTQVQASSGSRLRLIGSFTAPVSWPEVVQCAARQAASVRSPTPTPAPAPGTLSTPSTPPSMPPAPAQPPVARQVSGAAGLTARAGARALPLRLRLRLGLYGTRGGAGVSTAALSIARALGAAGQRVALFDATGRGDLHLLAGLEPCPQPVELELEGGTVTLFTGPPEEGQIRSLGQRLGQGAEVGAIIVDNGRERGAFNAEWIGISKPLSRADVYRLAGLALPAASANAADAADAADEGATGRPAPAKRAAQAAGPGASGTLSGKGKSEGRGKGRGITLGNLFDIEVTE